MSRIATGGMAEVYLGEALGIAGFRKPVAIKRVLPHLVTQGDFVQMLLDEGRLGAFIEHPNCVSVVDLGRAYDAQFGRERYFIVMEYVDGVSAKELLRWVLAEGQRFPVALAVLLVRDACLGLHYAHTLTDERGAPLDIVHRDVSPANVLVSRHGTTKVADFGVAKAATQAASSDTDIVKGKFPYLSPEALRQVPLDGRADVFAAGVVLWELLTGSRLFEGESPAQTIALVERAEYRSVLDLRGDVDPALDRIIEAATAREREQRLTARQLARELTTWLASRHEPVCALELAELVHRCVTDRNLATANAAGTTVPQEAQRECEHMSSAFAPQLAAEPIERALQPAERRDSRVSGSAQAGPSLPASPESRDKSRSALVLGACLVVVALLLLVSGTLNL